MSVTLGWPEIGLRLLLTIAAGALIGWNRGEHGHPAGLRTTLLVCLAASLAMISMNLLLDTRGKSGDSFAVMDVMRLPLGILSGMGFIGAGAIMRRGDGVEGVTTAATLWFVTMVGLCLGAGQLVLGTVATGLALFVLIALKHLELRLPSEHRATVEVTVGLDTDARRLLMAALAPQHCRIIEHGASCDGDGRKFRYEIHWSAPADAQDPAECLDRLAAAPGIVSLNWRRGAP